MVFAGYPPDMQRFMAQNDGLYRRVPYTFNFQDYSCAELAEIFELLTARKGFALDRRLLENGRQDLAGILEKNTSPETRALMNGGICERLFALAKQSLDIRDDPTQPSVVLNADDVVFACKRLPPPPRSKSESQLSTGASAELQHWRDHADQLQAENAELRMEIEQLRKEASEGKADAANATMNANATMLPANPYSTCAIELQGLQQLMKQARRLKAELQRKDDRLQEVENQNKDLEERLRQAEAAAAGAPPCYWCGTPVQYYSGSLNRWIDAVVTGFNDGKYDLDVKKSVTPDRVRRRGVDGGC